jgi:threonine dehydrogenase-like Zn-dependent dehydrogenase
MSELTERLARWNIHPEITVTHEFPLEKAAEAYDVADKGQSGKVAIVFE